MAERPDDLNLPASSVARVVKDTLPDGVKLSKDAQTAICKAASMFVLYCASCSNTYSLKHKRKTLVPSDVFSALEDMEFESFIPELKESLELYKEEQKSKLADRKRKQVEKTDEPQQKRTNSSETTEESLTTAQDKTGDEEKQQRQQSPSGSSSEKPVDSIPSPQPVSGLSSATNIV